MFFKVDILIVDISVGIILELGDIIVIGIFVGVGVGCLLQEWMWLGDVVVVIVEKIGSLCNFIVVVGELLLGKV